MQDRKVVDSTRDGGGGDEGVGNILSKTSSSSPQKRIRLSQSSEGDSLLCTPSIFGNAKKKARLSPLPLSSSLENVHQSRHQSPSINLPVLIHYAEVGFLRGLITCVHSSSRVRVYFPFDDAEEDIGWPLEEEGERILSRDEFDNFLDPPLSQFCSAVEGEGEGEGLGEGLGEGEDKAAESESQHSRMVREKKVLTDSKLGRVSDGMSVKTGRTTGLTNDDDDDDDDVHGGDDGLNTSDCAAVSTTKSTHLNAKNDLRSLNGDFMSPPPPPPKAHNAGMRSSKNVNFSTEKEPPRLVTNSYSIRSNTPQIVLTTGTTPGSGISEAPTVMYSSSAATSTQMVLTLGDTQADTNGKPGLTFEDSQEGSSLHPDRRAHRDHVDGGDDEDCEKNEDMDEGRYEEESYVPETEYSPRRSSIKRTLNLSDSYVEESYVPETLQLEETEVSYVPETARMEESFLMDDDGPQLSEGSSLSNYRPMTLGSLETGTMGTCSAQEEDSGPSANVDANDIVSEMVQSATSGSTQQKRQKYPEGTSEFSAANLQQSLASLSRSQRLLTAREYESVVNECEKQISRHTQRTQQHLTAASTSSNQHTNEFMSPSAMSIALTAPTPSSTQGFGSERRYRNLLDKFKEAQAVLRSNQPADSPTSSSCASQSRDGNSKERSQESSQLVFNLFPSASQLALLSKGGDDGIGEDRQSGHDGEGNGDGGEGRNVDYLDLSGGLGNQTKAVLAISSHSHSHPYATSTKRRKFTLPLVTLNSMQSLSEKGHCVVVDSMCLNKMVGISHLVVTAEWRKAPGLRDEDFFDHDSSGDDDGQGGRTRDCKDGKILVTDRTFSTLLSQALGLACIVSSSFVAGESLPREAGHEVFCDNVFYDLIKKKTFRYLNEKRGHCGGNGPMLLSRVFADQVVMGRTRRMFEGLGVLTLMKSDSECFPVPISDDDESTETEDPNGKERRKKREVSEASCLDFTLPWDLTRTPNEFHTPYMSRRKSQWCMS